MLFAIIISLLTGVTLVTSRVFNAKLAVKTSTLMRTFYKYLVGLLVSLVVLFILGKGEFPLPTPIVSSNLWIYTGGLISIFVVFITTVVSPKISSFSMTLLLFVGQLFAGVIIDSLLTHHFSIGQVIGGLFVAVGFTINALIDKKVL